VDGCGFAVLSLGWASVGGVIGQRRSGVTILSPPMPGQGPTSGSSARSPRALVRGRRHQHGAWWSASGWDGSALVWVGRWTLCL